jgi:hypothetical protein
MGFAVLTEEKIKIMAFWDVMLCSITGDTNTLEEHGATISRIEKTWYLAIRLMAIYLRIPYFYSSLPP